MDDKPMFSFPQSAVTVGSTPYIVPWKNCTVCENSSLVFKSPREFCRHLRDFHCTKEGGSFVCKYGKNGVCPSLPVEGVSDRDYEDHVAKDHVAGDGSKKILQNNVKPPADRASPPEPPSHEPSVVQDQHRWNIFMSRVNLPAALNDPRLSRRETDFFTKTWGESFEKVHISPSPHLPVVTRDSFKKYLKQTTKRYQEHSNSATDARPESEFTALLARKRDAHQAEFEQVPRMFLHPGFTLENPDTFSAVFPWTQVQASHHNQQKSSSPPRHKSLSPTTGPASPRPHATSKLLQEKLSHYLDVVEVQIARQISYRSEAFFHAMTSHDKLQENMAHTCAAIKKLRDRVNNLDHLLTEGPLKIIKLHNMRSNYVTLYNKLKLIQTVHQTQPTIQLLLATSEFVGALDLITTTQDVLGSDLQGLVCFRHLGSQLTELGKLIDKMMQEDFARYANQDLNRPTEEGYVLIHEERVVSLILGMLRQRKYNCIDVYREEACTSVKAILKQTVIEAVASADIVDEDGNSVSLADQMRGLDYTHWLALLQQVFDNLKVILMRVKVIADVVVELLQTASGLRQPLSPTTEDSPLSPTTDTVFIPDSETQHQKQNNLHELQNGDLIASELTNGVTASCDDVIVANDDIDDDDDVTTLVTDENGGGEGSTNQNACNISSPSQKNTRVSLMSYVGVSRLSISVEVDVLMSPTESVKVTDSVQDMVTHCCDYTHVRCEKLLLARAKEGWMERLSSVEFVELSRTIEAFVRECEAICGRRSTALRTCLQSQSNKFVNRFHEERKTKLSLIIDNERWRQADVPADFQDLVNHISKSGSLSMPPKCEDLDRAAREYLLVEREKYAVTGTALMLLKMMVEYCQCVDDIPSGTPDVLTRLIEIMKLFNSRTCQLILGAGALQLVGLKTITTKNLALACRCLQLVLCYLPRVQAHFAARLHGKQLNMLKNFEHIERDYTNHVEELSKKLVAIMDAMFDSFLPKWEVRAPVPSQTVRNICRQTTKLYEGIYDVLPQHMCVDIFERIHISFKTHLRCQLIKLGVTNDGGPQHGLVMSEVAFYKNSLKTLQGVPLSMVTNLEDIWDKE